MILTLTVMLKVTNHYVCILNNAWKLLMPIDYTIVFSLLGEFGFWFLYFKMTSLWLKYFMK